MNKNTDGHGPIKYRSMRWCFSFDIYLNTVLYYVSQTKHQFNIDVTG